MASGRESGQGGSGIVGWLHGHLSGGDRPVDKPGFFEPGTVGGSWQDYLKQLYSTDIQDSSQYISQSTTLRDALSREAMGQGEQFSMASNAGGFFDSGARLAGLGDINRNKMTAYSQGLTEILGRLEQEKLGAAYPFLQSQLGEYQAYYNARLGEENAGNYRANAVVSNIMSGFSMGMSGGSDAPSGGYIPATQGGGGPYGT
jgi:hypothetical protein